MLFKKLAVIFFIGICLPLTSTAQSVAEVKDLFRDWSPQGVTIEEGIATVILPQSRITADIFYSSIPFGFCFGALFGVDVDNIEEVSVLNQHGQQGWVFENDPGLCEQLVNMPANSVKTIVAGHSRLY